MSGFNTIKVDKPSNTGTTTHALPRYGTTLQVAAEAISATGTLTITLIPFGMANAQPVTGGVIDLTSPQALLIEGRFTSITLTASNAPDTYSLMIIG